MNDRLFLCFSNLVRRVLELLQRDLEGVGDFAARDGDNVGVSSELRQIFVEEDLLDKAARAAPDHGGVVLGNARRIAGVRLRGGV